MRKTVLSLKEAILINETLRKVLSIKADTFNGDGKPLWQYAPGHTDATIAATFSSPERLITKDHVGRIRRDLFGELIGKSLDLPNSEELHSLTERLRLAEERLSIFESRTRALEDILTNLGSARPAVA